MKTPEKSSAPSAETSAPQPGPQADGQPARHKELSCAEILNSLSSHICVVDSDGQIVAINRAWSRFGEENGGKAETLNVGSNYFEACRNAAGPEGREAASRAVEGINRVLSGQADQFEMEYDCHSPDEKRWFVMRVSPLPLEGRQAVVSHINITQEKRAEEELASLHAITQSVGASLNLESLTQRVLEQISLVVKPDLCLVLLREGDKLKLQGAIPGSTSIVDPQKQTHRVGECLCGISVRSGESVFSSNITQDHRCTYPECKAAGITSFGAIPLIRQGQAIGTIGVASFKPRDFSRNRRFLESAAADIAIVLENSLLFQQATASAAELKRQLVRRQELEAQLLQAHKMEAMGTLAGGIAHEFNNLLAIIKGNAELVQRKLSSPQEIAEKIARIGTAVGRATELVRQILSFSRPSSLQAKPLDLSQSLKEDMTFLRSTLPTSVEILTAIDSGPLIVNADNSQVKQVLVNLCTNAVHAMDSKGRLTVSLNQVRLSEPQIPLGTDAAPGPYARLSIRDSGVGMDQETLEKIFDPFFSTKSPGTNAGLGLSVVHGIAKAHGGFVTVDSQPGHGSTFHLYLPVSQGRHDPASAANGQAQSKGRKRILFVDDEEYLAELGVEMLTELGYEATSATSGTQALERFRQAPQTFDLVMTDQTMPGMSGIELAAELVKTKPDLPIILCSGYGPMDSEETLKAEGIRRYCQKPLSLEQLALAVREVLGGQNTTP